MLIMLYTTKMNYLVVLTVACVTLIGIQSVTTAIGAYLKRYLHPEAITIFTIVLFTLFGVFLIIKGLRHKGHVLVLSPDILRKDSNSPRQQVSDEFND